MVEEEAELLLRLLGPSGGRQIPPPLSKELVVSLGSLHPAFDLEEAVL